MELVGRWVGPERYAASPWAPAGDGEGEMRFAPAARGRVLVQDYRSTRDGEEWFAGHGVLVEDRDRGVVRWWWHDSAGFAPERPAEGRWEQGRLVLLRTSPRGASRHTFELDGDVLRQRIETGPSGAGALEPMLDAVYRRT